MKRQEVMNFGRFYSAFRRLKICGDPDDIKRGFVKQYTNGRTDSLKEMSRKEYVSLCVSLEEMNGSRDELKRRRSIVLKLMQELKVDTTDWAQINDFCRHPKIAGKSFRDLSIEELIELSTKLRGIKRKGWQRGDRDAEQQENGLPSQRVLYLMDLKGFCNINLN